MKITSTPPQRYRPRIDFEGDMAHAAGMSHDQGHSIRLMGSGERHWSVHLTPEEFRNFVRFGERYLERHGL